MKKTKPFTIGKLSVMKAYEKVRSNRGSGGVDQMSLLAFEQNRAGHLYKLWNQMSSGSYMPSAVKLVEIPKKGGGKRPLGIPTIVDRVGQTVVKDLLETDMDKIFHADSYGYRPNKSAHQAHGQARTRCWKFDFVIDMDIRSYFDTIPHDLLMKAVRETHADQMGAIVHRKMAGSPLATKGWQHSSQNERRSPGIGDRATVSQSLFALRNGHLAK